MKLRLVVAAGVAGLCAGPIGAAENVSPSFGSLSYSIPIEVPAYHGIEPRLSLNYSGGGNGHLGAGWSLSGLSMIQRVAPSGSGEPDWLYAPNYYTLDGEVLFACTTYTASAASCTAGGHYTTRNESFVKIQVATPGFWDTGNFTVTGRDGTKTVLSPLFTGVYAPWRWGQSSVTDTKGNTVSYTWTCTGGDCYPEKIEYNGYSINISLESRPDPQSFGYTRVLHTTQYRVKSIVVKAGTTVIRAYKLSYSSSPATSRSLLGSVRQFGKDAVIDGSGTVTGGTPLPPQTFTYQQDTIQDPTIAQKFTPTTSGAGTSWCNTASGIKLQSGDFNGDGKDDLICMEFYNYRVALSTGTGFATPTQWSTGVFNQVGDFNGDGKTDLGTTWGPMGLSTGTSFATATWSVWSPCDVIYTGDFDADGKTDYYCRTFEGEGDRVGYSTGSDFSWSGPDNSGANASYSFLDNTGDGKADRVGQGYGGSWLYLMNTLQSYPVGCTVSEHRWADFNGDGLADFTCAQSGTVWINMGGYLANPTSSGSWCTGTTSLFTGDIDGDGQSELICNNAGATTNDIQIRKWTGTGLSSPQTALASFCDKDLVTGDFNGDGKTDISCLESSTSFAYGGTAGFQADLLTLAANGLGGTLEPTYINATSFSNQNNPGPRWVVSSLTASDGLGNSATTNYSYSGGYMDRGIRKFMGFQFATEDKPANTTETLRPRTVHKFMQDRSSGGKPASVTRLDGADHPLTQQEFTYTTNGSSWPFKSFLATQRSLEWDPDPAETPTCTSYPCPLGPGKRTKTSFTYDTYGNVMQQVSHGDEDTAGDEVTTAISFTPNTSLYIVDKPNQTQVFPGVGTGGTPLLADTKITYDAAGYPTKIERWLNTNNTWPDRNITYDSYGNALTVSDETDLSVTTVYDTTYHTFPISITNPAGEETTMEWDSLCGVPTQTRNPNLQATTFQTDALCRPTLTSFPLGGFEQRSYPNLGTPSTQAVVVQTPSATPEDGTGNHLVSAQFDGWGRTFLTSTKGPSPSTPILSARAFHPRGSVYGETRPYYAGETPVTNAYFYDALDRPTATILPDSHERHQVYEIRKMTAIDENGKPTVTTYDAYGRQVTQTRGQGVTTESTYDLLGRLVGMQDAIGIQWSWAFDSLGRNTTKADPDAGTWTFGYDDAGRLISQTDAKFPPQTTFFDYEYGRLTTKATPGPEVVTIAYGDARSGFFNVGLPTTITSPGSALNLDYDAVGRPVKQTRILDSIHYVSTRTYDSGGFLRGLSYPDGDSLSSITYDAAGRLKSVPGILTSVTYNASGQPLVRTNADTIGTTTTKIYSSTRGFLTGIDTVAGSTVIQDLQYTPDPVGLVNQVTSPFANESWNYSYDDLYRLTSATNNSDSAQSQSWQYDVIGRITYNSRIGNYQYPGDCIGRPHAPCVAGSNTYTYDGNGNMLTGAGRTLSWDASNRIKQATVASTTVDFTYDGLDIRLKKTTGSSTSLYPLGDDYEITGGVVTKYVKIEGLGAVAKRIGSGGSIQTFWHHTDRLGSIQAITDASGALVQRRTYRPYGEKIADSTGHVESEGWIGERNDAETGLQFLHARYYDPALGVFMSPDPIGVTGGLNAYGYGFGNPAFHADPSGLLPTPCRDPETGYVPPECSGPDNDPFSEPSNHWWEDQYRRRRPPWTRDGGDGFENGSWRPCRRGECDEPGDATPATPGPDVPPKGCNDCEQPPKPCEDCPGPDGSVPSNPTNPPGQAAGPNGIGGQPFMELNPFVGQNPNDFNRAAGRTAGVLATSAALEAGAARLPCGTARATARHLAGIFALAGAAELGSQSGIIIRGLWIGALHQPHPAAKVAAGATALVFAGGSVIGLGNAVDLFMPEPQCRVGR